MDTFEDRKKAFEAKFAHDAELQFKVEARRNKMLGRWAAELLGKTGEAADKYAADVIREDFREPGEEDVFEKLANDLGNRADEATIRGKMREYFETAKQEILEAE